MSFLDKLMEGVTVESRSLGDLVDIANIGVDKKINPDETKVRLLNFVDVFKNQYISNDTPTMVVTASEKKIIDCNIKKGDVFITPSSELIDEIGFSAMAIEDVNNAVYSYHIMRLRINEKNILFPAFLNYLFNSTDIRKQIRKKAQGLTRFGLTQPNWKSIQIPIPSLEIQQKIVAFLNTFTELTVELTAELTAELIAHKQQYSYYQEKLLSFENKDVEWRNLGEVGEIKRGVAFTKKQAVFGEFPVVANSAEPICHHNEFNRDGKFIVVARSGANAGLISYWSEKLFLTDAFSIHPDDSVLNTKFAFYFLKKHQREIHLMKKGVGVPHVRASAFEVYKIPIPPIKEQERIVTILDKFDSLITFISEGLPKEIELRKKQYEYYRDMLLTFPNNIEA